MAAPSKPAGRPSRPSAPATAAGRLSGATPPPAHPRPSPPYAQPRRALQPDPLCRCARTRQFVTSCSTKQIDAVRDAAITALIAEDAGLARKAKRLADASRASGNSSLAATVLAEMPELGQIPQPADRRRSRRASRPTTATVAVAERHPAYQPAGAGPCGAPLLHGHS